MYEIYKLDSQDNLSTILEKFNTTLEELIKINGIEIIDNVNNINEIIVPKNDNKYDYYTVKKDDTIYNIANQNNIDYNLLLKMNGLEKDDYIYPNQTIMLPRKNINMYITKENDTINKILKELNTTIERIIEKNNEIFLEEDQIIIY